MLDAAPAIREGQFNAFRDLPNTGYAAAYDQQVNWYHPQKKVEVGERMARWALFNPVWIYSWMGARDLHRYRKA